MLHRLTRRRVLLVGVFAAADLGGCTSPPEAAIVSPDLPPLFTAVDMQAWTGPAGQRRHAIPGLLLEVDDEGAHVRRPTGDISLSTRAWGRPGALTAVGASPAEAACPADGACVAPIERRAGGLLEWWVARPDGAQQAWRLEERPAGDGPLLLELEVRGAAAVGEGDGVHLIPPAGRALRYAGVSAMDATGRTLSATLVGRGSTLQVQVDDTDAAWPLRVDPLLATGSTRFDAPAGSLGGFAASVASADFNGDGVTDVVVGDTRGDDERGRAWIWLGAGGGAFDAAPSASVFPPAPYDCAGNLAGQVVDAADVNRDGSADLLMLTPQATCAGSTAVHVWLGGPGGFTLSQTWTGAAITHATLLGDVNGDSWLDAAHNDGTTVKVYHGSATGFGATPARTLTAPAGSGGFGVVADAGNLNGDAYKDLVVGAPTTSGVGRVFLYLGSASGIPTSASQTLNAASGSVAFGTRLAWAGNINADAYDDLLIGDPAFTANAGRSWLYRGRSTGLNTAGTALDRSSGVTFEGEALSAAGDLNADGFDDVVTGGTTGTLAVWEGAAGGIETTPRSTALPGTHSYAAAGDIDADSRDDILVAAPPSAAWLHFGCVDGDDDGVCVEEGDCDDANAAVKPGATDSTGDGVDSNCDGAELCWADDDDDGYLENLIDTVASADGDCSDPYEGRTGDPATDCNDLARSINPGATEIIGDGVDQNCNNQEICYDDDDDDGYLDTSNDTRTSTTDLDCDDAREGRSDDPTTDCNDTSATINPGRPETIGDSVDQNCDGRELCYEDDDDDNALDSSGDTRESSDLDCDDPFEGSNGLPTSDCNDNNAAINVAATEIIGNGIDENCNNQELCYDDDDDDGFLDTTGDTRASSDLDCLDSREGAATDPTTDCNDTLSSINPNASEVVDDGTDQNCDTKEACYDDDDDDNYLDTTADTRLSDDLDCADAFEGTRTMPTTDCNDNNAAIRPGVSEITGDSIDQNCDNVETCFDDDDNDGFLDATADTRASSDTDCNDFAEGTLLDPTTDCNDALGTVYPGAPEVPADGVDQDCDLGDTCYDDDDDDGYLDSSGDTRASVDMDCVDANEGRSTDFTTDCNDNDAAIWPRAVERPGDLVDQNCDGVELCFDDDDDDGYLDASADTRASADMDCDDPFEGDLSSPTTDCQDLLADVNPGQTELIGNGVDNDCDGGEICFDDRDNDSFLDTSGATRVSADGDCNDPFENNLGSQTTDCDDLDPASFPGATERVADGIDQSCDGTELCFDDDDADGFLDASGDTRVSPDLLCDGANEGGLLTPTTDCHDNNAAIRPGVAELPGDEVDQDCDSTELCLVDGDDDGWLIPSPLDAPSSDTDCDDPGEGALSDPRTDCDDADAAVRPGVSERPGDEVDQDCDTTELCFEDDDRDGFLDGSADVVLSSDLLCDAPGEGRLSTPTTDCNDADAAILPGATELAGDEVDQDCDGAELCLADVDNDGFLIPSPAPMASADADCVDPGEGRLSDPLTDCNDRDSAIRPTATERPGDEVDQNCDGREVCYFDRDDDGFLDTSRDTRGSTDLDCQDPNEGLTTDLQTDCNDLDAAVLPGATERAGDDIDQDCDGTELCFDDDDADGFLDADTDTRASADTDCADPGEGRLSTLRTDCDDTNPAAWPGASEIVGNSVDEDCDNDELCFDDDDDDGFIDTSGDTRVSPDLACDAPFEQPAGTPTTDCNDAAADVYPGAPEIVGNEIDNDCDRVERCFRDLDDDGWYGSTDFVQLSPDPLCDGPNEARAGDPSGDCADANPDIHPDAVEGIADNIDQDCDGRELCLHDDDNDRYLDASGDTVLSDDLDCDDPFEGKPTTPTTDCNDDDGSVRPGGLEPPGDGVDSDCDGGELCYEDDDDDGFIDNAGDLVPSADLACDGPFEASDETPRTDCADQDPTIFPGAVEGVGDEIDQDCDRQELCLHDVDDDGWVSDAPAILPSPDADCNDPHEAHAVAPAGDCDDNDASVHPAASEVVGNSVDEDCDGGELCFDDADDDGVLVVSPATITSLDSRCDGPFEGALGDPSLDCDDNDPRTFPGAPELLGDAIDEDCDGSELCLRDEDEDGFRTLPEAPWFSSDTDCDDLQEALASEPATDCDDQDPTAWPGAPEVRGDEIDQDCDGGELCLSDADGDGFAGGDGLASADIDCDDVGERDLQDPGGDCDDEAVDVRPGATELAGDAIDGDCDGSELCLEDADDDGFLVATPAILRSDDADCEDPLEGISADPGGDCDDTDAAIHPGAVDSTGDEVDSDCDGVELCWLDADDDGFLGAVPATVASSDADCQDAQEAATGAPDGDCDDGDPLTRRGAPEIPGDEVDEDCDGRERCLDDADDDGFIAANAASRPSADLDCDDPQEGSIADPTGDCDADRGDIFPGAAESAADGLDQDCDGGDLCFQDADNDGQPVDPPVLVAGNLTCSSRGVTRNRGPADCDDVNAEVYAGASEGTADGIDSDCDGNERCYSDTDGDGYAGYDTVLSPALACTAPGTSSAAPSDCDDQDARVNPGATDDPLTPEPEDCASGVMCAVDLDRDGWTAAGQTRVSLDNDCEDPGEAPVATAPDCDDDDNSVFPGATDIIADGVDADCDGVELCHLDLDGDGQAGPDVGGDDADCNDPGELGRDAPRGDCDDDDASVYLGATERPADGVDSDCDRRELCWVDADGDGETPAPAAPELTTSLDCLATGYTDANDPVDCDDGDADVSSGATERPGDGVDQDCDRQELCYLDNDSDGWRTTRTVETVQISCVGAGIAAAGVPGPDCNDSDASIYPGAPDAPGDGIDQNCDEAVPCLTDADGDGFSNPDEPLLSADGDCDDPGEVPVDAVVDCDDGDDTIFPGAPEYPADDLDSDCDGRELCYGDLDGDGYTGDQLGLSVDMRCDGLRESPDPGPDCDDDDPLRSPGAEEPPADGVDQDCDGLEACHQDADGDGWTSEAFALSADLSCAGFASPELPGGDCDDDDAATSPQAGESAGDGVDSDCNGQEVCFVDADGDGWRTALTLPSEDIDCEDADEATFDTPLGDCDDDDGQRYPGAAELPGDGVDQDCDGSDTTVTCFADSDGDGWRTDTRITSDDGDCSDAGEASGDLPGGDCDDGAPAIHPDADEVLSDGVDQDCDGRESCRTDADGDSWGVESASLSSDMDCEDPGEAGLSGRDDCDDLDGGVNPAASEIPGDGVDQDCDGSEICFTDADDDGLRPLIPTTLNSADLDCDDPTEGDGSEPAVDCDDSSVDADMDGIEDGEEHRSLGTDPCQADSDGDALSDGEEIDRGTDPTNPDSDDDGVNDGEEIDRGTDPLVADSGDDKDPGDDGGKGCSCDAGGAGGGWMLLGLLLLRRRRR